MEAVLIERRALLGVGAASLLMSTSPLFGQVNSRTLRWSTTSQLTFARFTESFVQQYAQPVDCADLAIDSLITFAAQNRLPVRLFDFDGPRRSKRWLTYDPRADNWRVVRAYLMQQLGAINVIENSVPIELSEVRPGDLIMHEEDGDGYTGHTRVLISAKYDRQRNDYFVRRYEGTLPPVVPVLKEGWFKKINEDFEVYRGRPRRWNFGQFGMG